MVSVACAAAGIIVGMVTLTGMGLKFSSLVLDLSFGIKALAILLIGAASLVLGVGENYDLLHWEVGLTMVATTLGLVAFTSALERFFLRRTTWPETILFYIAAAGLFWPAYWADIVGLAALVAVILLQKFYTPKISRCLKI